MTETGDLRDILLSQLADEFAARHRAGERPSLQDYCDRHPDLADDIRSLFPAMVELEQAKDDASERSPSRPSERFLKQLGDYRIIREIGCGGMGVVYEAEQVSLGRHVALKLLPNSALHDARQKRRFEREARAAAKLHHTNIVPVFGVGEHDGVPYYVMQFIQGLGLDAVLDELNRMPIGAAPTLTVMPEAGVHRDLSAAEVARSLMTGEFQQTTDAPPPAAAYDVTVELPACGIPSVGDATATKPDPGRHSDPLPLSSSSFSLSGASGPGRKASGRKPTYWQSVANIGRQVADALEYAHKQGIQHRDVKPSNLLLDLRGTVWVTDFGLAKLTAPDAENLTHTGDILGTLRYMPPEAFEGKTDARSDVYSLGLTLYELLAMRPAYDEKDRNKLIKQVTTGEAVPLDKVRREIPRDLVTIVQKSIAREPSRRYATAEELASDLQRYLDDEPILARRQTQAERLVRWARHNPGIATLSGALAAVLVAATVASLVAASYFNRLRINEAQAGQNERAANALAQQEKQRADENARKADQKAIAAREAEEAAKTQLTRAEWLVYAGRLSLAQTDFETSTGALALKYLDECQWSLRGWEHRALWTRFNAALTIDDASEVWCVAFSPDGTRVISGSQDHTAKVRDAATGQVMLILKGHTSPVRSVMFSPDGKRIATGGGAPDFPAEAKVWDAATGNELLSIKGLTGEVWSLAFSPDGTRIATGTGNRNGGRGEVKVWDATTGKEILDIDGDIPLVLSVAFSPDGQRIVTAGWDATPRMWHAISGDELVVFKGHTANVRSVAFSRDGKRLLTCGDDKTIKVWDVKTGREVLTLKGHTGWVISVAFSHDGNRIVSGSADTTVREWDAATGRELHTLKAHAGIVHGVALSPDGKRIVSGSDDRTLRMWDAGKGQNVLTLNGQAGPVRSMAFSPDSKRLVAAGAVWDAATGQRLLDLQGASGPVAFSPDGQWIVTGSPDMTAKIWDAATGRQLRVLEGHTGAVWTVAYSPDGKRIVTGVGKGYESGESKVWDAATGKELTSLKSTARIWSAVFSPDGKRILTGDDHAAKLWDAATGEEVMTLREQPGEVWSATFSRDGTQIITGCLDKIVRVWNAETGKLVHTLTGHTSGVWSVAMSPDGKRIFSGSQDHTVRIWDAEKGQELLALKVGENVLAVSFSPDGHRLAAGSEDGAVRVWVAGVGQPPRTTAEYAELLKERLPALLRGDDKPRDNLERLAIAQIAFDRRKFAFAARLWAEAMAIDPALGEDRATPHRFNAARAAALAAAEPGADVALRRQARDWLRAELHAWGKILEGATLPEREAIVFRLDGWKYDADFATLRDDAALWSEIAGVLKEANARLGRELRENLTNARATMKNDAPELAYLLAKIGRTHLELEQWAEAEPYLRECLAIREQAAPDSWTTFNTYTSLGGSLLGQKKYTEAEPLLLKGYAGMKEREGTIPTIGKNRMPEAVDRLIAFYAATDKPDELKTWQAERVKLPESAK